MTGTGSVPTAASVVLVSAATGGESSLEGSGVSTCRGARDRGDWTGVPTEWFSSESASTAAMETS